MDKKNLCKAGKAASTKNKGNLLLSQCSASRLPRFMDGLETHFHLQPLLTMVQITSI